MQNKRLDLVKLDVEGAEGLLIQGAEETIKFNKDLKIIMEFWPEGLRNSGSKPEDLLLQLKMHNFKIKVILDRALIEIDQINEIIKMADNRTAVNLYLEK